MDRSLYPENWGEIALGIKQAANWRCEHCGRPCRMPGESIGDLYDRLAPDWELHWWKGVGLDRRAAPGRFVLTVAHLNHKPMDCSPDNLRALCTVCHGRYDLAQMPLKLATKLERCGQLRLAGV